MEPTTLVMDDMTMAVVNGLFDDCTQSAFPSTEPRLVANNVNLHSFGATEQIMNNNGYSFPSNDLAGVSWDIMPSKLELQQLVDSIVGCTMDFTPELSPAMSICTPAANTLRSPFAFDNLGLDELGSSPSVDWQSPLEDAFGSQQSQESFDYDFGVDAPPPAVWPTQTDFQLFPENAAPTVTSLQQLLMTSTPDETDLLPIKESPYESDMDCLSPLDSAAASPSMSDYTDVYGDSSPASASSSRRSSVYKPPRRHRRLRVTSEDESRVIPEHTEDDPNPRPRYKCSVCDKTFSRPFNLRSHRTTHAGVKPFTCEHTNDKGKVCGWSFARRHDLERHTRSRHCSEKQFKCANCGTECGRSDAFKRHFKRHPACSWAAWTEQQDPEADQAGA